MRRIALFLVGISLAAAAGAQGRRPPLPAAAVTAVADGRSLQGVALVQVEKVQCLSMKDIRRLTGARAAWRRLSREVVLSHEGRTALFTLDASTAVVDGRSVAMEAPVRWWTGQPYVPLSFVLSPAFQSFAGATILWEPHQRVLAVTPVPDVSSPRFTAQTDRTRVVFDVAGRVDYRVLNEVPGALALRLFGGRSGSRERLEVQDPLITAVDIMPRRHSTDVIVYLGPSAGRPRVFLEPSPRRVIVDVRRGDAAAPPEEPSSAVDPAEAPAETPTLLPAPAPLPPLAAVPAVPAPSVRAEADVLAAISPVHVIVVDPGHGGKDVGAVGKRGTLEKDVNLVIAKELAKALGAGGRYEVHLTRSTDEFISLQERAEFANRLKADLFISVHCNAALSAKADGFEVYFLSERATDDAAAAVARRENASLELEGPSDKVQAKVAQLLWSLAKTEDLNESSEMAALVHRHAEGSLDIPSRGVKQAGFYVLKWARMPAVLVESAFITNPREEKLLRSPRYVDKLVKAVVNGVRDYEKRKVQTRVGKSGAPHGS